MKESSSRHIVKMYIDLSTTWMSTTIDLEYSSNLSLMSISSYVGYETGNMYMPMVTIHFAHFKLRTPVGDVGL